MTVISGAPIIDVSLVTRWINQRRFIWQLQFISADDLCKFARDRGLSFGGLDPEIKWLWQMGMLRADFVIAEEAVEAVGLSIVGQTEEGHSVCADNRDLIECPEGLAGVVASLGEFPAGITLMFHPFRYYVLCRIEKELELRIPGRKMQHCRVPFS